MFWDSWLHKYTRVPVQFHRKQYRSRTQYIPLQTIHVSHVSQICFRSSKIWCIWGVWESGDGVLIDNAENEIWSGAALNSILPSKFAPLHYRSNIISQMRSSRRLNSTKHALIQHLSNIFCDFWDFWDINWGRLFVFSLKKKKGWKRSCRLER